MVTRATLGCSGQCAEQVLQHAGGGGLADRDRAGEADDERRPRGRGPVEELLLVAVQPAGRLDVQAQQPADRQVDVADLLEVELVAETAQRGELVLGERVLDLAGQRRPGGAVELDVGGCLADSWPPSWLPPLGMAGIVSATAPGRLGRPGLDRLAAHVRDRRIRRSQAGPGRRPRRAAAAGVPRLRLRRDRASSTDGRLAISKKAGKLANLEKAIADTPLPASTTGVGHTRWATHGAPNDVNAHPHLRATPAGSRWCTTGSSRTSPSSAPGSRPTTTPWSPRPTPRWPPSCSSCSWSPDVDLTVAMQRVCQQLEGAFTLVAVDALDPSRVVAARRSSPLVVGLGDGENFLGSDVAAFIEYTREALELGQDQVVTITRVGRRGHRLLRARPRRAGATTSTGTCRRPRRRATTGSCARRSSSSRARSPTRCWAGVPPTGLLQLDEMRLSDQELRDIDKIIIIACGTSFYAGMVAKYAIEHWTRVPVEVELSSEFRYRDPILDYSTLVVAISQSGETADTLQAIRHARTQRSKVLAICNTNGSTIPRESDAVIYTHAGPEIGVASTKGFLTQLVACYLLALYLAQVKGTRFGDEIAQVMTQLEAIPAQIDTVLESRRLGLRAGPRRWSGRQSVLFVGRHAGYPVALEGALKLKELAYLHAEGFAAGELSTGRSRWSRTGMPVFCVVPPRGPRPAPRQDAQRHPGGPRPRRPHDLPGRGGRRADRAVRRRT